MPRRAACFLLCRADLLHGVDAKVEQDKLTFYLIIIDIVEKFQRHGKLCRSAYFDRPDRIAASSVVSPSLRRTSRQTPSPVETVTCNMDAKV